MLEEVKSAIFDQSAATGLKLEFLGNLSAEFIGVIAGVLISFLVAYLLDKMGNNRQFRPLRQRLARRLVGILERLLAALSEPFRLDTDNSEPVGEAIHATKALISEFDFGLTGKQQSAVDAFLSKLQLLEDHAKRAQRKGPQTQARYEGAAEALRRGLRALNSGRLEKEWRAILERGIIETSVNVRPARTNPVFAFFNRGLRTKAVDRPPGQRPGQESRHQNPD